MDSSVQRVQPEPVVAGRRDAAEAHKRRKREGDGETADEPQFTLEPQQKDTHAAHAEPRSPSEDGLGRNLDVTA